MDIFHEEQYIFWSIALNIHRINQLSGRSKYNTSKVDRKCTYVKNQGYMVNNYLKNTVKCYKFGTRDHYIKIKKYRNRKYCHRRECKIYTRFIELQNNYHEAVYEKSAFLSIICNGKM